MDDKTYNQFNEQGQPIGVHHSWNDDMTIQSEIHYNDKGQLDGQWRRWTWNGQLVERLNYKEGKLDGRQQTWTEQGAVAFDAYYKDGVLNGPYTEYYAHYRDYRNASHVECNYENGQLHGEFRRYGSDGFIEEKRQFDHDTLNGFGVFYGRDKDDMPYKQRECFFKNGKLDGPVKSYYENREIKSYRLYEDGKLNGTSQYFYDDGSLSEERTYKDGELNGLCKEYDRYGEVYRETYFKDSLVVSPSAQADEAEVNKLASELFDKAMDSEQENHHNRGLRL